MGFQVRPYNVRIGLVNSSKVNPHGVYCYHRVYYVRPQHLVPTSRVFVVSPESNSGSCFMSMPGVSWTLHGSTNPRRYQEAPETTDMGFTVHGVVLGDSVIVRI